MKDEGDQTKIEDVSQIIYKELSPKNKEKNEIQFDLTK